METKSWLKNVGVGVVKKGCGLSGHRTLKLAVSQERIDEIKWFFVYWYTFMEAKRYFDHY